ncbi:MAG: folate-binding protein YgfZ [Xanthomonadales bacterium]|nr:folate-binding protein YgfZ [Xanthomonadales bacterium]
MASPLCAADIVELSGADVAAFTQAQFCNDVRALATGRWQWNAWLDAQGRARHFFALLRCDARLWLAWLPLGGAAAMREELARFVFRSDVQLRHLAGWTLHRLLPADGAGPMGIDQAMPHRGGFALAQPGGIAWLAPQAEAAADAQALATWRLADVEARLPFLAPALSGQFVAQALGLDRLGVARFDKGCYPGQEIVARLHFRGGNKRHLQRLSIAGPAPAPGTGLLDAAGRNMGSILYAAPTGSTSEGLGVVSDAASGVLRADGCRATLAGSRPLPPDPGTPAA